MKAKLPQASEHQIQDAIIGYLWAKGYYVQRLNSGKIPQTDRYGKKRLISLAPAGTPDLMAFRKVESKFGTILLRLLFIEVKVPGNKPTILQEAKMEELEGYGAKCLVIHSVDELEKLL